MSSDKTTNPTQYQQSYRQEPQQQYTQYQQYQQYQPYQPYQHDQQQQHGNYQSADHQFIRKEIVVQMPLTNDDAIQVLMNWNFVRRHFFLRSLRENIVKYGQLTNKQIHSLRNTLRSNTNDQAYVC